MNKFLPRNCLVLLVIENDNFVTSVSALASLTPEDHGSEEDT